MMRSNLMVIYQFFLSAPAYAYITVWLDNTVHRKEEFIFFSFFPLFSVFRCCFLQAKVILDAVCVSRAVYANVFFVGTTYGGSTGKESVVVREVGVCGWMGDEEDKNNKTQV